MNINPELLLCTVYPNISFGIFYHVNVRDAGNENQKVKRTVTEIWTFDYSPNALDRQNVCDPTERKNTI